MQEKLKLIKYLKNSMDSGATTYNDVMRNYHSTINLLMRPIKRKKIIQNVLIKAKESR